MPPVSSSAKAVPPSTKPMPSSPMTRWLRSRKDFPRKRVMGLAIRTSQGESDQPGQPAGRAERRAIGSRLVRAACAGALRVRGGGRRPALRFLLIDQRRTAAVWRGLDHEFGDPDVEPLAPAGGLEVT